MTQYWAYVGESGPGGGLDWGGDLSGNIPAGGWLVDLGPPAFWAIVKLVRDGRYDGRKVDWGAWALKVNGPGLRDVLTGIYGPERIAAPASPLRDYLALADELGEDRFVAFVAAEL
jgi:hypothetical protein